MIDDLAEGLFRFLGRILIEVVFEIIFKGPGYLIVRLYSKDKADADGFHVFACALLFWGVVVVSLYLGF